jgi:hypothetical protein
VKKEVWWDLYQSNRNLVAQEVRKIREKAEQTFDNPEAARKLIDAFLRKVSPTGEPTPAP